MFTLNDCLAAGSKGIPNLPIDEYHTLGGISGSKMGLLELSFMHLDNAHLFFQETPALIFGNLYHTLTLEPEEFESRYAVLPKFVGKTKSGYTIAEAESNFRIDNKDKIVVTSAEHKKAKRMARNTNAMHPELLSEAVKERSLFIDYNGLILKCRIDAHLVDKGIDTDIKSVSLGVKPFTKEVLLHHSIKFGYHLSAAFRRVVLRLLGLPVKENYLLFCCTDPGNKTRLIRLNEDWMLECEESVIELLDNYNFYKSTGIGIEVDEIDGRER